MSAPAIRVENLSKRYTLHHLHPRTEGLRHILEDTVSCPWRALKHLRRRSRRNGPVAAIASVPSDEDFWALKGVSFEVQLGEVVGIIGRNGSGKSTLLKILSRITEPTTGRIEIEGRVASLLEVGTGFHQELTGRENIYLNGAILGMSRQEIRNRFDAIVAFAEVEKFLDTPVKRYSSGMYVRLAFAVAAHIDPEILVVDEVLAVGDAEFQRKCLGKMKEVASGGRTVLFVSHAIPSIKALCSTALVLKAGELIMKADVNTAIEAYAHIDDANRGSESLGENAATGVSLQSGSCSSSADGNSLSVNSEFSLKKKISNCGVGIHIGTKTGYELSYLRPETTGLRYGDHKGTLHVAFRITELAQRLSAGEYTLSLSLHETNWRCCLERIPIGEFVVPPSDFFGTGYPPKFEKDGPVIFPVQLQK